MTFTPGIPTSGESLGTTKLPIQNNFTNYFNVIAQNHVAPNGEPGPVTQGKHKFLQMPSQGTNDATTLTNEMGFYVKGSAPNTFLGYRTENNGTFVQISGVGAAVPTKNAAGKTFLPGGMMMMWGSVTLNGGTKSISYSALSLPNFSAAAYSIQLSVRTSSILAPVFLSFNNNATTGFDIVNAGYSNSTSCYWLAIGPQ